MVNDTTVPQEPSLAALRKVKVEGQKIDANALLGLAANVTTKSAQKKLLSECLQKCPSPDEYMSECHFKRKALCPALTVEGAYHLIITLGGGSRESTNVKNCCHAVGVRMLSCQQAATELFESVSSKLEQQQTDPDPDENKIAQFHEARMQAEARHTATINRLQASAQAVLLAVQLQKEVTGGVPEGLQRAAQGTAEQIEHMVATQGTRDAIDILKLFGHSDSEARQMASSFGKFLAAARMPTDYTPTTRHVQFGPLPSHCNDVALYHPKLHADIINSAYERSPTYAKHLEKSAEVQRNIRRRHMQIMDVAETHSRPRESLVVEGCRGRCQQFARSIVDINNLVLKLLTCHEKNVEYINGMASELETKRLLEGIVAGNPFQAFGLSPMTHSAQLRKEVRQRQASFHQDRGNPISTSQLANGCTDAICGRAYDITETLKATATPLLLEIRKQQGRDILKEWAARDRQAHYDRVTSSENKRKAEMLLSTFELVPRSEATPFADVRQIFQRAFGLSNHEAGWLVKELGIRSVINLKTIRVAINDSSGLKIPSKASGCSECPMCGYCWKL